MSLEGLVGYRVDLRDISIDLFVYHVVIPKEYSVLPGWMDYELPIEVRSSRIQDYQYLLPVFT